MENDKRGRKKDGPKKCTTGPVFVAVRFVPISDPQCAGVARLYRVTTGAVRAHLLADGKRYVSLLDSGFAVEIEKIPVNDVWYARLFGCVDAGLKSRMAYVKRAQELIGG